MQQSHASAARPCMTRLREGLQALGLERWLPVLETWLPHFDGWRSVYLQDESIIADDAPAEQVCELLARYAQDNRHPSDGQFAEDLAHLDFLTWRARHDPPGSRWNCLEEPFLAFAQRGEVQLWQYDTEYPSAGLVKYWLLGQLYVALHESQPSSPNA